MAKGKKQVRQAEIVRLFSVRLRDARVAAGMTQLQLAEAASVTTSYIWKLESGATAPGIDLVDRLATALGTTASDLLVTTPPDQDAVLRDQVKTLFESVMADADRDDLVALAPLLARFSRTR